MIAIATAGDLVQWHPHVHLLTTDGGRAADGAWQRLPEWDGALLMTLFRERLLARLVESHVLSQELVAKLVGWKHPGFSTHVGEIGRILDHLGLSTPEAAKPPPPAPEVLRVAEHGDGWGVPAEWE